MLTSIALTILLGICLGYLSTKVKLPTLVGMILTGLILGPYGFNLLDPKLLGISVDLRQVALVIILMRAGLALDLRDLKAAGRPAVLLCFLPACFEISGITLIAPHLLPVSYLEAGVIGAIVSAVSPAVVVPKMLKLMDEGYGTKRSIPQMIMAGGSVDDVFVIYNVPHISDHLLRNDIFRTFDAILKFSLWHQDVNFAVNSRLA